MKKISLPGASADLSWSSCRRSSPYDSYHIARSQREDHPEAPLQVGRNMDTHRGIGAACRRENSPNKIGVVGRRKRRMDAQQGNTAQPPAIQAVLNFHF